MSNISVEPDTIVKLLRCGLQRGSGHQLTFANATAQQTYFESRVLYSYTDFTYVRENNSIAVGQNVEDIRDCNYLMYQNKNFGNNKWFYAFITDLEYVNENCTRVYFETDSWQTWVWDIDLHPVFIEREHTNDDTVGANTVPEDLETGDYICVGTDYYDGLDDLIFVIQATADLTGRKMLVADYGGVPMYGGAYLCYGAGVFASTVNDYLTSQTEGVKDAIINCYVVPKKFIKNNLSTIGTRQTFFSGDSPASDQQAPITDTFNTSKHDYPGEDINFTPKNNKLRTYPYVYLTVSNNNGCTNIYKYEEWTTTNCTFALKGVPSVGGSVKIIPSNYWGGGAEDEGLIAGKFPALNWANDNFVNWLTQNATNLSVGIASEGINMLSSIGSVALGAGVGSMGTVIGGSTSAAQSALNIASTVATVNQHKMKADSVTGHTNGGDINICSKKNGFLFYKMSIKTQYARIIDDYFTMYGYKTNRVKYPNLGMTLNNTNYKGRLNWNYVKTIGCTFDAKNSSKMSRQDEINIQQMFDNGVTLWHNPATMYDYSQPNTIVS